MTINGTKKQTKQQTKRGVSLADYELYRRMVRSGKTTWRRLEKAGKVQPPHPTRRQAAVLKELAKK